MRKATLIALVSVCLSSFGLAAHAFAQTGPSLPSSQDVVPIRVRHFEGAVNVQRAIAGETTEAMVNLPLDAGDRLWTDADGRAELVLPDGSLLWLDARTTIDVVSLAGAGGDTIIRLWGGSVFLRRSIADYDVPTPLRIDTANASNVFDGRGVFRIDLDEEHRVWLSVFDGHAAIAAGGVAETVLAGERTYVETSTAPAEVASFNTAEQDEFGYWQADRLATLAETEHYASGRDYVPANVTVHAADLERHGDWFYYDDFGSWAWRPTVGVSVGWTPYRHGRWMYGYGGWSWVSSSRWGWTTSHYGRWHHLPGYGWVWFPGRSYSPGWVSWAVGYGYVGWSPIGYYDRPYVSFGLFFGGHHGYGYGYHGRYNYPYSGHYGFGDHGSGGRAVAGLGYARGRDEDQGWSVVETGKLGNGGDRAISRVDLPGKPSGNSITVKGPMRAREPGRLVGDKRPTGNAVAGGKSPSRGAVTTRPTASSRPNGQRPVTVTNKPQAGSSAVRPRPQTPTSRPKAPAAGPRTPTSRPKAPIASPKAPVARPKAPTARPDTPAARPKAPTARPKAPAARPKAPAARPQAPTARPKAPAARPKAPVARPKPKKPVGTSAATSGSRPSSRSYASQAGSGRSASAYRPTTVRPSATRTPYRPTTVSRRPTSSSRGSYARSPTSSSRGRSGTPSSSRVRSSSGSRSAGSSGRSGGRSSGSRGSSRGRAKSSGR